MKMSGKNGNSKKTDMLQRLSERMQDLRDKCIAKTMAESMGTGPKLEGKMELFNLVNQHGSISKAANLMGMSFSRANMLLNTIQEAFEKPVLIKNSGNKGTKLTEFGLELLEKYLKRTKYQST